MPLDSPAATLNDQLEAVSPAAHAAGVSPRLLAVLALLACLGFAALVVFA